jgi:hypothetical protein
LIDEGLLSGVVKAARHGRRVAVVEVQTMQQVDQAGTAIALAEGPFQEGRDLWDAAGTVGVDPIAQRAFLLAAERLLLPSWPKLFNLATPPRWKARCQSRTVSSSSSKAAATRSQL